MHRIELDVQGLCSNRLTCFNLGKNYDKKELSSSDWLTLIGALCMLAYNNRVDVTRVLRNSAFSDDELCLNSFEGYQLSERLNLRSLYLSGDTRTKVIASVYDKKKYRRIDFITW